jgi:hypothetical protein
MRLHPLVFLSFALLPVQALPQVTITTLKEFSYHRPASIGEGAKIAFDNQFAYVSSPDGEVYRTPSLTPSSHLTQVYSARTIAALNDTAGTLYVLAGIQEAPLGLPVPHSMVQSTNHGASFVPIDKGLKECLFGYCQHLSSSELIAENNLLFVNAGAGRNLLVSDDLGDHWTALSGFVAGMVCTHSTFEITGSTVLQGGECPLDIAFIDRGTLLPNQQGWIPGGDLKPTGTPNLENRNVMTIKAQPGTDVRLAGAEGAVLRSIDDGKNFTYAFKNVQGEGTYPYVQHILFPSSSPSTPVIGGFDKATGEPYLAVSNDDGESWVKVSSLLPGCQSDAGVSDVAEDTQGRIIIVVTDFCSQKVIIAQVTLDD